MLPEPIPHRIPGLILTDHWFDLPLDYNQLTGPSLRIFARSLVAPDKEKADLPWLVFLQGGPGFGAGRPDSPGSWYGRALREYRVLLLDQRGTGRSTPVLAQTLQHLSPQAQAAYLQHFRADNIVRDAEAIRAKLGGGKPWTILGQSYGGFCALTYLSQSPEGLHEVLLTGGLPPLNRPVDDVYRATYPRVIERNRQYYQRYPDDAALVGQIATFLTNNNVTLPGGGQLTVRRFQQLGLGFGMSNGFEQLHYLLDQAFVAGPGGPVLSYPFLRDVENMQSFESSPIYAILHEPLYCQGQASNWSAERLRREYPEFSWPSGQPGQPLYFTGEMVYPWMFEDYVHLRPLKESAEILAQKSDWPSLYNPQALRQNQVPVAAAVYYNDMYVERLFSEETAAAVPGIRLWVTSEHEHSALRMHGEDVLDHLLGMLHGMR